jgi:protein-S-isoprenylcysteine O-methyltransferase Ste14
VVVIPDAGPLLYRRRIFAGIGLLLSNWLSLAALLLSSVIGLLYRIHVEEAALAATVGDAYRSYAAGHKRLLPFLW